MRIQSSLQCEWALRVQEQVHITFVNRFTNTSCDYITFVTQSAPLIRPLNIIQHVLHVHPMHPSLNVNAGTKLTLLAQESALEREIANMFIVF